MQTARKIMVENLVEQYVRWEEFSPYLEQKMVPTVTSKLLAKYSNIYCSISGKETECPVFLVKSKKTHDVFLRVIIEREF